MADVMTPEQRSRCMSHIKGKDTKPELRLRKALWACGLRYRLHRGDLPGKPDLVLPKYRTAIFVHGCFWHVHGCRYSKRPKTRAKFWDAKLAGNVRRDAENVDALNRAGWRVMTVWECALRSSEKDSIVAICNEILNFLRSPEMTRAEIPETS